MFIAVEFQARLFDILCKNVSHTTWKLEASILKTLKKFVTRWVCAAAGDDDEEDAYSGDADNDDDKNNVECKGFHFTAALFIIIRTLMTVAHLFVVGCKLYRAAVT